MELTREAPRTALSEPNAQPVAHRQVTDSAIKDALGISVQMVQATRKRFALGGLEEALFDAPHTGRPAKFDGKDRAAITALACSEAPEGHAQWSIRLLAERAVELNLVDSIAPSTVFYMLKKTRSNHTAKGSGASRN